MYGVGRGNELLACIVAYRWAFCMCVGVGCVECGEKGVDVLLDEWCVQVGNCVHCFFPLCEEWLWDGKVKSYGLGGGGVVRGFGCGKLDVVFEW